jgi:nucleotide-binding universal stress UspA family protein
MYDTILVATDGSDPAEQAVERGLDLAERYGATLHALFVVDTRLVGEPALSSTELVVDELEDRGHELLNEITNQGEKRGVEITTRCCHGVPHEEIVEAAAGIDADLLVLGYSGQTHQNTDNIGSVAERVTRLTDRSVLLV